MLAIGPYSLASILTADVCIQHAELYKNMYWLKVADVDPSLTLA